MSRAAVPIDLLLRLLEAREPVWTHHALVDQHGAEGAALIDAGLVVNHDHEKVVYDVTLGLVEVESVAGGSVGYRDAAGRWVEVMPQTLRRYRPDLAVLLQRLFGGDLKFVERGPLELVSGILWQAGTAALGRREPTEVWFARRLAYPDVVERLLQVAKRRSGSSLRLVLTTTPPDRVNDIAASMCCVVSIADAMATAGGCLDKSVLAARLRGQTHENIGADVYLSADGVTLFLFGKKQIRFSGEKQQAAIKYMVDMHRAHMSFRARAVAEHAGSNVSSMDKIFGRIRWPELNAWLASDNGEWRFIDS